MINFLVSSEEDNQTIISFLKRRFKRTSISLVYKLFRTKKVQVNQQNCRYYHYRLKVNDQIIIKDKWLQISTKQNSLPLKPKISVDVVYEDQNILLVAKEHNVEIYKKNDLNCLDNQVQYYLYQQNPEKYQEQWKGFFVPVALHRLDKLTKGIVIYPKNSAAKKILYNSINDKSKITKTYLAICENYQQTQIPESIRGWIVKSETKQKMEFSLKKPDKSTAKYCALNMQKLSQQGFRQLYKITLDTGRKHQIRAIFSFFQASVIGDKKYGSKIDLKEKILLFAYQLKFNNLPQPLSYLNKRIFTINKLEESLISKKEGQNCQTNL